VVFVSLPRRLFVGSLGAEALVGHQPHVAAPAAVAAVRSAELDEFLPPESDHAVAAVA